MKNAIQVSVAAALLAASYGAGAVATTPSAHDLPTLEQESQHAVATKRISSLFTRAHYKEIELNDALSGRVYDRFLKALDPNKNVFTAADVAALEKYRQSFDDALERGQLVGAYDIYQQNLKRRVERYEYALSLLEGSFDFEKAGDVLEFNREDADWPKDIAELNELWRQRVKYDALNLKMAGKDDAGIKDLLNKRYERAIKRLQQTESEDVFQTLMNSFARTIEAHTSYLSPRNAERFQMDMNLSFEGIGAVLQSLDDHTVIRSVVPGGPADLSKQIKPEDRIIGVAQDDEEFVDVVGWRLDEVVDLIKGPKGSIVRLQVLKGTASDSAAPEVVSLTRDKIKLEDRAAKSEVYVPESGPNKGQKLGVISIPSFYNNLHEDVRKELDSLKSENVEGVIVDLRGNGGGSLSEATQLTGLFIDKGPVVQIRDSAGRIREERDNDGIVYYDGPLTVLVDRYSASASEIFAAAMQDYGRALIVGEQTFGKGTVQQHRGLGRIYDLYDNPLGSVQITIAKFYRINGGSTQHKGVVPDVLFPSAVEPSEWGESREENALPWDSIQRANYTTFGETGSTVREVTDKHAARIQQDPEFAYILEDISEYRARKDDKTISLVESERRKEKQDNEQKALARANERLTRMGLAKVENLDDLPEALDELDPILDEAAAITYDVVGTGKYAIRSK
ncbi:carboxy terminal-processing peptidase [Bowmanella pacifica]|uniref:Tail-specific protease n=1 Tax=Bowmanella pacifica TaxID=502051 RepID=A0A917Z0D9_9ALTE|nr:carboxy terminal-processing peptidase [Bowmanella pacifica]GGO69465.1 tail-specific protease [Bowmanella pacifica]